MPLPKNLADAVRVLGERESRRLHELPAAVFQLEVLKGLDHRGLVKIHLWDWEEDLNRPSESRNRPVRVLRRVTGFTEGWFSPIERPSRVGSWEDILKAYPDERSPEIRLTKKGLDEFDALGGGKARPPGESRQTRGIDEVRIYELVNDDGKTYEQAGISHAREQRRDKPYSPEAIRKAYKRHEATLADMGLTPDGRSVSRRSTHRLRDDDGATT